MNLVLVSNAPTPDICNVLNIKSIPKEGWVTGLVSSLKYEKIQIYFVFPHRLNKGILSGEIDGIKFYGFPKTKNKDWEYEAVHKEFFLEIFNDINRIDVIHIMGTEMGHTLSAVEAAEETGLIDKVVISIQGLVSYYSLHYYANLPYNIVKHGTLRDILRRDNIMQAKATFSKRGEYEISALKKVKHIIGRTDWDKGCTFLINPDAEYHFCNEILRNVFYDGRWHYEKSEPHTIFMSQGNYPIKGLHNALEALVQIKRVYPNVKLRVTGSNPLTSGLINRQKRNSYTNYIETLIREYKLQNNVEFLGILNADEMKREYLRANVFVSSSAIENSPNSVGEAMILGTPVVASDVGGVKNLLEHGKEGYVYQSDAPYMLAYYVMDLFANTDKSIEFSKCAKEHAEITHSPLDNAKQMKKIYEYIAKKRENDQ